MDFEFIGITFGVVGLVAASLGVYAVMWGLGFFDYLDGKKPSSISPVPREELGQRILAFNDETKPFQITRGTESDFVLEWRLADAKWYGVFNRNGLKEAYRGLLLLDESRHAARYYEELGSISWNVGIEGLKPSVTYRHSFFHGRILFQRDYAVGYGMKDARSPDWEKVYDYKFDVNDIRSPLASKVKQAGWEWVPVSARRNATYA